MRVARTVAAASGAALLLAACAGGSNLPPPKKLPPNPHLLRVDLSWSHDVGGGGGSQLLGLAPGSADNMVVAASAHGYVAAFDAGTGKTLWSRRVKARLSGGPAVAAGLVVLGTRDGYVVALDAHTGVVKWRHYVGAPVITSPGVGRGIVAAKTIAGAVVGLDPSSGSELWTTTESVPSLTLRFDTRPFVADGVVYAGFADGKAAAVDAETGKELWRHQVASGEGGNLVANMVDVGGVMGLAGGDLYVATYQGRLAALDADSGAILWSRKVSSYTGVELDAAHVYVSDAEGRVHAYDLVTGVPVWTYAKLGYRGLSAAVPYGGLVAVGDKFGWLHLIDRNNGKYLDRVHVGGGPIRMPPVVVDGRLIVLDGDGTLAAYRVSQPK